MMVAPDRPNPARILITRPQPDATDQARELQAAGHHPVVSPLLHVRSLDVVLAPTEATPWSGIIATSRNALRALEHNPARVHISNTRIYTVGPETTAMAKALGFTEIAASDGNAADLAQLIMRHASPEDGPLLRLAGCRRSNVADIFSETLPAAGFKLDTREIYRIDTAPEFTSQARNGLLNGEIDIVLLMSPLTAATFSTAIKDARLTVESEKLRYVCLSESVAERLDAIPRSRVFVADKPNRTGFRTILDRAVAELP